MARSRESAPQCPGRWPQTPEPGELLDSLGMAVLAVDPHGGICYRNALARDWLPDAPTLSGALIGGRFQVPFDGWPTEVARVLQTGTARRLDGSLAVPNRSRTLWVRVRCLPWPGRGSSEYVGAIILVQEGSAADDVAEQSEVSYRLAALGKLAARVAHELNNPLDGILRYVNLALRIAPDTSDSKLKSYLHESRTGLLRMVQIISDVMEYSRSADSALDSMTVNQIVEQALHASVAAADERGIISAVDFQTPDMPPVAGSRLYQVCTNLIRNALDAMPQGGRLSITTGVVHGDVVIRVADTGVGLPDPAERVFEPFYTTKEPGKGTGLGLTICRDFVEEMGGTLTATPADGGGAVFTVRIPVSSFRRPRSMGGGFRADRVVAPTGERST